MSRILKDVFSPLFSKINITLWTVGSLLAAIAGPFETYGHHGFPSRFLFWILVFSSSTLIASLCGRVAYKLVGGDHPLLFDLAKVVLMIIAFTPILLLLTELLVNESVTDGPGFFILAQSVAAISTAIIIARRVMPGFERQPYGKALRAKGETKTVETKPTPPRLTRRLPNDFVGPILRLAVRDHFVDVITSAQTHTIRLRFKDAIDEMDSVHGFCTHRSHWVCQQAIIGPERENGRTFLRMSNQDLVPVSRKYKPELEKAGVL